jgi:hypothetical protein
MQPCSEQAPSLDYFNKIVNYDCSLLGTGSIVTSIFMLIICICNGYLVRPSMKSTKSDTVTVVDYSHNPLHCNLHRVIVAHLSMHLGSLQGSLLAYLVTVVSYDVRYIKS